MQKHPLYSKIGSFYDLTFQVLLGEGNRVACRAIAAHGAREVLEVGVGTGFSLDHYEPGPKITGIDLNTSMLAQARERAARRPELDLELIEMDAQNLQFDSARFDAVWMPSVLTVVPDPARVVAEAMRVLRPGGLLIAISHFVEDSHWPARARDLLDPLTKRAFGFTMKLSRAIFVDQPGLVLERVEPTNFVAGLWPLSFLATARKV